MSNCTRREFIKSIIAIAITSNTIPIKSISGLELETELKEAMFYKQLDGVMIQCLLEPRGCIVNNWERGYCGAKENRDGKYYSLVYSKPSAVYVEPIESDHFFHVHPGKNFLGIGTAGCNLGCKFCETWHLSQVRPEETETQTLSPDDAIKLAIEKDCKIINFTYNDPVICYEYVLETAKKAKTAGLITLCHTAGYLYEEPLKELLKYIDAINVDLKGFTEEYYSKMCGVDMEQVLNTLKIIKQEKTMLEITNLIIPNHNDNKEEITEMVKWISENLGTDVPLHFARFFPNYQLTNVPATPEETLEMVYYVAKYNNMKYVYIDNVSGHHCASTYCPKCGDRLIYRNDSGIEISGLTQNGECRRCGFPIPGIWN